jgi:hypothetical protein
MSAVLTSSSSSSSSRFGPSDVLFLYNIGWSFQHDLRRAVDNSLIMKISPALTHGYKGILQISSHHAYSTTN